MMRGWYLFSSMLVFSATVQAADRIEFNRDIRPILSSACFACHGPDRTNRKADLRLDTAEGLKTKLDDQQVVLPGDSSKSALFQRITSDDSDERMPPADSERKLSPKEIELLRTWIEQGAQWQGHWSFITPKRSSPPRIGDSHWVRNAVDGFISARWAKEGLKPSPAADKRTLIRRVTLDLTGLPPSLPEVDAFLADARPDAYERLVDRLLSSSRFGERMAMSWLDAARYADTHGYHEDYHREMWPWRDWVINAFNANMPFDQFTIEQLAGDLLPGSTDQQKIATGFNRNHGVTASGISEEYRVEYVIDRVKTTGTVWMGLTIGCAQCHAHKYDPISQEEFYQFFAYFNTITDKGVENRSGNVDPLMKVVQPGLETRLASLKKQIAALEQQQKNRSAKVGPALIAWEKKRRAAGIKNLPQPTGLLFHYMFDEMKGNEIHNAVADTGRGTIQGNPDWKPGRISGALRLDGKTYVDLGDAVQFERTDAFSYGAWVHTGGSGAVISRMDDGAAYRGFDLYAVGDKFEAHMIHKWPENSLHLRTINPLKANEWHHVFVTYNGSSKADGFKIYIDGKLSEVDVTQNSLSETIRTDKPLHIGRRNPSGFFTGMLDDVRIYGRELSSADVGVLAGADPIDPILAVAPEKRTKKQQQSLHRYFLENHDAEYKQISAALAPLGKQAKEIEKRASAITVMVMQEMPKPRDTFVLNRGQYDQPVKKVQPGTMACLPPMPKGASGNRLGMARWLVSGEHPLTGRVAVNRMWQMLFGTGIVKTSEDFGTQGEWPSHLELLDWLATEFVRSGWDVKAMMWLMVTSATYRQSSKITPALLEKDPQNRLLARGPRYRLPAELIRDNALAISGLLVEKVGGPSVKPYQPGGLWRETSNRGYAQDHGANLYRRSIYTYWKRSVPLPNMVALDAPNRETCTVRRQRTNTPLMALVLMNDPTFVEAARVLAERVLTETPANTERRIAYAFRLVTARKPSPAETAVLLKIFNRQRSVFTQDQSAAKKLLAVGESKRNETLDPAEHAAWTAVASLLLNLDETITKE